MAICSFLAHFHLFLRLAGNPTHQYKVPLIFVRDQQNLLQPFGSQKMTHNDNEGSPNRNYGETEILLFLLVLQSKSSTNDKNGRFSVIPLATIFIVIVGHFLVTHRVATSFVVLGPKLGVHYIGG